MANNEKDEIEEFDSVESNVRYLAYASRIKTAMVASSRYLAYSSDVGEAFRPVVLPAVVRAAYGISWAYLGIDVAFEGYKAVHAGKDNSEVATAVVKRGVFQSLASMALPMMTIHTVVKQSARAFVNVKNPRIKMWGPTSVGLAVLPFLPYLFDHPVEGLVDRAFEAIENMKAAKEVPTTTNTTR